MGRLSRVHLWVLLIAGAVCLLTFQGSRSLTEHEVFAAEPAREMLAGQGWILQPFAGEYRTKKPPGQSWLIAASLAVTQSHSEWAARLPSALSGIGLAALAAIMTARLGASRQGLIAGLMTLTCVGVQQRARLAEADMALAFFVGLANAAVLFASSSRYFPLPLREGVGGGVARSEATSANKDARPSTTEPLPPPPPARGGGEKAAFRRAAVLFWLAVVAGFMVKGPIVLGFTLLPAFVAWAMLRFALKDQPAATAVRRVAFWWPAVVVGLLLIVGWPLAAYFKYPGIIAQWKHEIVDRIGGKVGHGDEQRHDPLIAYLWLLPQSALPWFPFAIIGGWVMARLGAFRRPAVVFLACWAGCGFVLVSAIAFKVLHYVLPIVPPVLMLAAIGFDWLLTRWLRSRPRAQRTIWANASLAGWFGLVAIAWLIWSAVIIPKKDLGENIISFGQQTDALVPPGQTIYLYNLGEERTAWYLNHPLKQTTTIPDQRPAYLMCTEADAATLPSAQRLLAAKPFLARDPADIRRVLLRVD